MPSAKCAVSKTGVTGEGGAVHPGSLVFLLAVASPVSRQDPLLEAVQTWSSQRMEHILICCVCLGDNSEDADEIIQCDNCGVTVHEGELPLGLCDYNKDIEGHHIA